MGRQVKLSLSSQDVFSVSLSLGESQIQSSKMMSLRILCLVASLVYVHGAIVKRDAGYGSLAPAPANAPIPPPVYGVAPAPPAYGAPPAAYGPVVYYEEKPDLKEKIKLHLEELKDKIVGTFGHIKGTILTKKGEQYLKKAAKLQQKGQKLVGIGESLKALKQPVVPFLPAPVPVPAYGAPPAPPAP